MLLNSFKLLGAYFRRVPEREESVQEKIWRVAESLQSGLTFELLPFNIAMICVTLRNAAASKAISKIAVTRNFANIKERKAQSHNNTLPSKDSFQVEKMLTYGNFVRCPHSQQCYHKTSNKMEKSLFVKPQLLLTGLGLARTFQRLIWKSLYSNEAIRCFLFNFLRHLNHPRGL